MQFYAIVHLRVFVFLRELSTAYSEEIILLVCDGVAWHKSNSLEIPEHIEMPYLPPAIPETNPAE